MRPESRRILQAIGLVLGGLFIWNLISKWWGLESTSYKDFVTLVLALLSYPGWKSETVVEGKPARPFQLPLSFTSGVYGGLIGGTVAGMVIGVGYVLSVTDSARGQALSEIVAYAALVGTVTGGVTLLFVYWSRHLADEAGLPVLLFNEITGGTVGGILGGLALGALGGYWFGMRAADPVPPDLLVWGAVTGPIAIVLGALLYDFQGDWRKLRRACITAALITIAVGVLGIWLIYAYKVYDRLYAGTSVELAIKGGAIAGAVIGLILGLQVGVTLFSYQRLQIRSKGTA
jgi:hypothetical protein